MPRLPVRPLAGALTSALVIVMTCLLGAAPSTAAPVAVSRSGSAIELDTDLTLLIARCEGCVITLLSYDGANPVYSSVPATVTGAQAIAPGRPR